MHYALTEKPVSYLESQITMLERSNSVTIRAALLRSGLRRCDYCM